MNKTSYHFEGPIERAKLYNFFNYLIRVCFDFVLREMPKHKMAKVGDSYQGGRNLKYSDAA